MANPNLPAPRPEAAPAPAAVVGTVVEQAARLWGVKYSDMAQLSPSDRIAIGALLHAHHPEASALELVNQWAIIGGKIYPLAEYWLSVMAAHPELEAGPHFSRLDPESPAWQEWMGGADPAAIAAACLCKVRRRNRTGPVVEVGYCPADDPLLFEYSWQELPGADSRATAERAAAQLGNGNVDRISRGRDGGWVARIKTRRADWAPLAAKIARTRAVRRCARLAFSLGEARLLGVMRAAQHALDQARAAGATAKPAIAEPAAVTLPPERALPPASSPVEPAPAAADDFLEERHRRLLFSWGAERDLGVGEPLVVLKQLLAEALGIPLEAVSTKRITYAQLPAIQRALEARPFKDQAHPEVAVVCKDCGALGHSRPGQPCGHCVTGRWTLWGGAAEGPSTPAPAAPAQASPAPVGPILVPPDARPGTLPFAVAGAPAGIRLDHLVDGALIEIRDELRGRGQHDDLVEAIDELLEGRRFAGEVGSDGLPF